MPTGRRMTFTSRPRVAQPGTDTINRVHHSAADSTRSGVAAIIGIERRIHLANAADGLIVSSRGRVPVFSGSHFMNAAIAIAGVTKRFGNVVAVDDLDLEVPRGSLYGFIGPNGSGKTTTLRMIMHILLPDRGGDRGPGRARHPRGARPGRATCPRSAGCTSG